MKGTRGAFGGIGQFFIGIIMMCVGFYQLFHSIAVQSRLTAKQRTLMPLPRRTRHIRSVKRRPRNLPLSH